jgi:hypothetical protein
VSTPTCLVSYPEQLSRSHFPCTGADRHSLGASGQPPARRWPQPWRGQDAGARGQPRKIDEGETVKSGGVVYEVGDPSWVRQALMARSSGSVTSLCGEGVDGLGSGEDLES